tara:strand:+ start:216 stop:332 length:117 start_codon:yes stop_codon:yes gene_type:complete
MNVNTFVGIGAISSVNAGTLFSKYGGESTGKDFCGVFW